MHNQSNECSVCGSPLESYSSKTHLPPSWIKFLVDSGKLPDKYRHTGAYTEVCKECQKRIDELVMETLKTDETAREQRVLADKNRNHPRMNVEARNFARHIDSDKIYSVYPDWER